MCENTQTLTYSMREGEKWQGGDKEEKGSKSAAAACRVIDGDDEEDGEGEGNDSDSP